MLVPDFILRAGGPDEPINYIDYLYSPEYNRANHDKALSHSRHANHDSPEP